MKEVQMMEIVDAKLNMVKDLLLTNIRNETNMQKVKETLDGVLPFLFIFFIPHGHDIHCLLHSEEKKFVSSFCHS